MMRKRTTPTSTSVTVNPAAASKLTLQAQPSATATAGAAFAQQPVIRIEDAYGNLRSSDNSTVVTVTRSAGSGTLQGTLTATAVNGVATFANLSHNLANTITLSFTGIPRAYADYPRADGAAPDSDVTAGIHRKREAVIVAWACRPRSPSGIDQLAVLPAL